MNSHMQYRKGPPAGEKTPLYLACCGSGKIMQLPRQSVSLHYNENIYDDNKNILVICLIVEKCICFSLVNNKDICFQYESRLLSQNIPEMGSLRGTLVGNGHGKMQRSLIKPAFCHFFISACSMIFLACPTIITGSRYRASLTAFLGYSDG